MRSVSDVLPPRLPAVCMVSGNLNTTWFDLNTPTGQHGKWFEKYSLHSIFTFYLNRDTSVTELFPVVVFKKISRVESFTDNESKPSRIVVEPGGGGGGGGGGYSLYEGYYICSSVSTPLFQVSGKFVEFRPLYFSKNEENVVFWPLYFSKNEENVVFRPLFFIKIGQNV